MRRALARERGQAMVEMAVALPVFVLVIALGIDGVMLAQQYASAGHAAEQAARAVADALLAEHHPLDQELPDWAADMAAEEVSARLRPLPPAGLEVAAEWAGPPLSGERTGRDYVFTVSVPDAPNRITVADLANRHPLSYQQPDVGQFMMSDSHTAPFAYRDATGTTQPYVYSFPHSHGFPDWVAPPVQTTWYGPFTGIGGWTGGWFWWGQCPPGVTCFGFGPAAGAVGALVPLWQPLGQPYRAFNSSDQQAPSVQGTQASPLVNSLSGTTDPFQTLDMNNNSWMVDFTATSQDADVPQNVGPHAYLVGRRTYDLVLSDPVYEEVQGRPLRVVVQFEPVAFTPILRPLVAGRRVTRAAVVLAGRTGAAR
jgi:hypothetical protein